MFSSSFIDTQQSAASVVVVAAKDSGHNQREVPNYGREYIQKSWFKIMRVPRQIREEVP